MRNSLIIKGLEGVKMAVFTVLHLFSRVCKIRHKFNLTNVMWIVTALKAIAGRVNKNDQTSPVRIVVAILWLFVC